MIETSNMPEKTWVFKLESFEDSTILLIKRYTIIKTNLTDLSIIILMKNIRKPIILP